MKKIMFLIIFISNYAFADGIDYQFKSLKALQYDPRIVGLAALVVKKDTILFEYYTGKADFYDNILIDDRTMFESGSMLKIFTAIAIAKLEQSDKIDIMQPAKKYLPKSFSFLPIGIRVCDLMIHRSGVPDYLNDHSLDLHKRVNSGEFIDDDFVFSYIKSRGVNKKKIRKVFEYSNSNYVLLAKIIETISGKKYSEFMKEEVLRPAGMKTAFIYEKGNKIPHEAKTYDCDKKNTILLKNKYQYITHGDFGLQFSIQDIKSFIKYLKEDKYIYNKLFDKKSVEEFWKTNYSKINYGYGMRYEKIGDIDVSFHRGSISGVSNIFAYSEKLDTFVVLFSNSFWSMTREVAGDIFEEIDLNGTVCAIEKDFDKRVEN